MKSSIIALFIKVAAGALNYLLFISLSNTFSVNDYSLFVSIFSASMLLSSFFGAGQQNFIIKTFSLEDISSNRILNSLSILLASIVVCTVVSVTYFYYILDYTGYIFAGTLLLTLSLSLSHGTLGFLRVQNKLNYALISKDIVWRFLVIVAILIFSMFHVSIEYVIFTAGLLMFLLIILQLVKVKLNAKFTDVIRNRPEKSDVKTSFALALIALISGADFYLYTIIAHKEFSNLDVSAAFSSFKTVELIGMFLMVVSLVYSTKIADAVRKNRVDLLQSICNKQMILQIVPTIVCVLIVFFLSSFLLGLYNADFKQYALFLQLLMGIVLFNSLCGSTGSLLQLCGLQWHHVVIQSISLILSVIAIYLTMDYFGIYSLIIGYAISKFLWNILAVTLLIKKVGVDPTIFGLLKNNNKGNKNEH
ncbi:hypothetical protein L0B53_04265 [Vibrio sp. SS-MA-C1-2]|uniref:hypothetical protein n=1 Tax=Vibrio sp. SS-MA-C1-2 TaxID=2908646 RepID=UPI001F3B12D1|nr:hypothetical protein [Vibrio sp. SS-MA-C1-2]UJF17137.1 hypothetical protein L0B53_04265 [Vibrio sp. SS-MA-C1-2]